MTLMRSIKIAAAFGLMAVPASAATLTISSISGHWQAATPATTSGVGTDTIRWGTNAGYGQSGYHFSGADVPTDVVDDARFTLGTFTHLNNPIYNPTLETAELVVSFTIEGVSEALTSVFSFAHWETVNNHATCANGDANGVGVNSAGCADRVSISGSGESSESFIVDDEIYQLNIVGFLYGESILGDFWTREWADNSAHLIASFETLNVEVPSEVPLPASGLLLFGGLAGLVLARRRR